ncbi:hypothetical protein [Serratia sp. P2ACOL2]|uniref:hypothetical protein n=1 Tax=Serratia sp. P2ACOL2 TaxID=2482769 RepID=UPI00192E656E|nr:hypothetical protein [Serratia sp. P2ACOL2]
MDKLHEESRKQFDAWWHEEYCHLAGSDEGVFVKYAAWQAWQDSRASIVVELPEPHAHLIWIQAGHAPDDYWDDVEVSRSEKDKCCDGSDRYPVYAEHEIAESLRSIGLSIKGE